MASVGYYSVSFNANGGSGAPSAITGSTEQITGTNTYTATVTLPSTRPSRNYYTFLGWGSSSGATSASHAAGSTMTVNGGSVIDITLWAVWRRNTAYVYYNANGGTGAPAQQSHNAGTPITLSATRPTRTGYTFKGWATSASATSAQYQPNTSYNLYVTTTLYAVWESVLSKITVSNGTLGEAQNITITNYDSTKYTTSISWAFGTQTGTVVTKTAGASTSWTPAVSLASEIPNAAVGSLTYTVQTYEGNTLIGTTTKAVTLTVPDSTAPTVSVSYTDVNAVSVGFGVFVQARSALNFVISAAGQYGATIAAYLTAVNGSTYTLGEFTTGVLIYNGSNTYTVTVTDSRGISTTVTGSFNVTAYTSPACSVVSVERDDNDESVVDLAFTYSVTNVGTNAKEYAVQYKQRSADSYSPLTSGTLPAYSGGLTLALSNMDADLEFDYIVTVSDSYSAEFVTAESGGQVGTAKSLIIQSQHAGGIGFGMKSQGEDRNDFLFAVYPRKGTAVFSANASGSYAKILTLGSSAEVSKNLAPRNEWATGRRWWGSNINSSGLLGAVLETLPVGTYTLSWRYTLTAIPQDTTTTLQVGKYIRVKYDGSYHILSSYSLTTIPSYAVGDTFEIQATITINAEAVGQAFEVLAYCGQNDAFYATLTEYQIEVGTEKTPFEPYVDFNNLAVTAPITLEYARSGDDAPTRLTMRFNADYTLGAFTSDRNEAHLVNSAAATWDLYIYKATASDSVEILDFHNSWRNSDVTVEFTNHSVNSLPSGSVQASLIDQPTASAYGDLTQVGQSVSNSPAEISMAASTYKTVAQFTLPAGKWIISGCIRWGMSNTGRRWCALATTANANSNVAVLFVDEIKGWSDGSGHAYTKFCSVLSVSESTTYYLNGWQNSGAALAALGRLMAIRIG